MATYTTHELANKVGLPYSRLMRRMAAAKRRGWSFKMREDIYVLSEADASMLTAERKRGRPKGKKA